MSGDHHLAEGVREQEVSRTSSVDEDTLDLEIRDVGRDDEGVLVWEIHSSGIFGVERDWYLGLARWAGYRVCC